MMMIDAFDISNGATNYKLEFWRLNNKSKRFTKLQNRMILSSWEPTTTQLREDTTSLAANFQANNRLNPVVRQQVLNASLDVNCYQSSSPNASTCFSVSNNSGANASKNFQLQLQNDIKLALKDSNILIRRCSFCCSVMLH